MKLQLQFATLLLMLLPQLGYAQTLGSQTITFNQPPPTAYKSTFNAMTYITPGAAFSDAPSVPVIVTTTTPLVCSVDVQGIVTMLTGTGTCVLVANQAGDAKFSPAPSVTQSVTAQLASQAIAFTQPPAAAYKSTFSVSTYITPGAAFGDTPSVPVVVTTTTPLACTIDAQGLVTMLSGTASCVLEANQAGDANYSAAPTVTQTVSALLSTQTITFNQPPAAAYKSTFNVLTYITPGAAFNDVPSVPVVVTTTTPLACSIDAQGLVTMLSGTASCVLAANQAGDANYSAAPTVTQTVSAQLAAQAITFNQPPAAAYKSTFNALTYITPGAAFSDTPSVPVVVTTTTPLACSVDAQGVVTMLTGTASCVLEANQAGDANYSAAPTVTQTVSALLSTQTITFTQPPAAAYKSTFNVTAYITPGAAFGDTPSVPVVVTTTTPLACSIDPQGVVTMLTGTASCVLEANQAGDANYSAAPTVTQTVSALLSTQTITFTQPPAAAYKSTFNVLTYITPGAAFGDTPSVPVIVTTTTPLACSIDAQGLVTMLSGTNSCVLVANQAGDANYGAAAAVTQTVSPQLATQTITFNQPPSAIYKGTFNALTYITPGAAFNDTPSVPVVVTTTTPSACSVDAQGLVTMLSGTSSCLLVANQHGDANYSPAGAVTRNVSAQLGTQAITFSQPPAATYKSAFNVFTYITPGAASNDTPSVPVVVTTSTPQACSIDAQGLVTMLSGTNSCVLVADQNGDANYSAAASVTRTVVAHLANQSVTLNVPQLEQFGTTFDATATSSAMNDSNDPGIVVTISAGPGCTGGPAVSPLTVTMGTSPTCTITATQAGDHNYSPATTSAQVALELTPDVLTWTAPLAPASATMASSFLVGAQGSGSTSNVSITANGPCSLTNGNVTPGLVTALVTMTSGVGSCVLEATQPGDNLYSDASPIFQTIEAAPQTVTIAIDGAPQTANYGSTFTVSATETDAATGSKIPLNLAGVAASGACSIDQTIGLVTLTSGIQNCYLSVSQPATPDKLAATTSIIVTEHLAPTTTTVSTKGGIGVAVTPTTPLPGVTAPSGTVLVKSSTGRTCTVNIVDGKAVDANSCLHLLNINDTTIVAAYSGDNNFAPSTSDATTKGFGCNATGTANGIGLLPELCLLLLAFMTLRANLRRL